MVQNCSKVTDEVFFLIKQIIYGFTNAQSFYVVNFLNSLAMVTEAWNQL